MTVMMMMMMLLQLQFTQQHVASERSNRFNACSPSRL